MMKLHSELQTIDICFISMLQTQLLSYYWTYRARLGLPLVWKYTTLTPDAWINPDRFSEVNVRTFSSPLSSATEVDWCHVTVINKTTQKYMIDMIKLLHSWLFTPRFDHRCDGCQFWQLLGALLTVQQAYALYTVSCQILSAHRK